MQSKELMDKSNPFFQPSPLMFEYPQFGKIENKHFLPAFEQGMMDQIDEIEVITEHKAAPTFSNTIVALELSGQLLDRVSSVFFGLVSAHTNEGIQALEQQLAAKLADHHDSIYLDPQLFDRVKVIYDMRKSLKVDTESKRLVEQYYLDFVRAGAELNENKKQRILKINTELALLQTKFRKNVLSEVNSLAIVVDSRDQLAGLDDNAIKTAAKEAENRKLVGKYVLPLLNTSDQPVLVNLENRALRERIHTASLSRGSRGGDFDNRETASEILGFRAERAQLLGFSNHAQYILENQTAQTVEAVNNRLAELISPAVANAKKEALDLQAMIAEDGQDFELAAWDWAFYTERLRKSRYNFTASKLKPYFELDNVLKKGVFHAAEKLYGITFKERTDFPVYQEDVRVFEVADKTGATLCIFIVDYYARPSKRGGAWMRAYVPQNDLLNSQPVIANHLNITKPLAGQPTLLTFGEVTTMFHEFGHALHGMFSKVTYPYFSGTRVPRDFVEFPSQVNEMWASWPEVLKNYAIHYQTGEPMPIELLEQVLAARKFNQGFKTSEYLAASLLDQALHQLGPEQVPNQSEMSDFETNALVSGGIAISTVPPRYRSNYFSHIMGGYAAGYYSYIWSEVLDADTVEWFKENDGILRKNGDHFRNSLLSKGGSDDAMTLYRAFRGRDADIQPLLKRRGLN